MDSLNGFGMPILYYRSTKLPRKPDLSDSARKEIFNIHSFPSSSSTFNEPKQSTSIKSDFLFYDGAKNTFSEQKSSNNRKSVTEKDSSVPRPTNSFICARSMLQKLFEQMNVTTIQCSNIMSDVSNLYRHI